MLPAELQQLPPLHRRELHPPAGEVRVRVSPESPLGRGATGERWGNKRRRERRSGWFDALMDMARRGASGHVRCGGISQADRWDRRAVVVVLPTQAEASRRRRIKLKNKNRKSLKFEFQNSGSPVSQSRERKQERARAIKMIDVKYIFKKYSFSLKRSV